MQNFLAQFKLNPVLNAQLEGFIFAMADKMIQGYNGGTWDDATVGKCNIVTIPGRTSQVTLYNRLSGNSLTTDRDTASAAFICLAVNWFWNSYSDKMTASENNRMGVFYNKLRNAVYAKNSGINTSDYFSFTD